MKWKNISFCYYTEGVLLSSTEQIPPLFIWLNTKIKYMKYLNYVTLKYSFYLVAVWNYRPSTG